MMTWLKIKEDKIKQLQKDKVVALDKIATLRKMKKDFPKSDDVRFSLQDAMTDLNKIDKQLMMLD
jgi:hypothetical protein|tara:strand:- start:15 stop:209 length:195 start_codon:yes stop_codon:yes gene_type:complete